MNGWIIIIIIRWATSHQPMANNNGWKEVMYVDGDPGKLALRHVQHAPHFHRKFSEVSQEVSDLLQTHTRLS